MSCHVGLQRLLLLSMFLLLIAACRSDEGSWAAIQKRGTLRVGMDPTFPPFELADGGEPSGLDVDIANTIAQQLGLRAEFVLVSYDGLYDSLATGQVDLLLSAMVVSPERTRDFAYSASYFNAGEVLIITREWPTTVELSDLADQTIAVELGSQGHLEVIDWANRVDTLVILPLNSSADAVEAVSNGAANAAVVDAVSGRLAMSEHPMLQLSATPVSVEPYAAVVRIEDSLLLRQVNEQLALLHDSGKLEEMIAYWLGEEAE